jgi:hypothetical protein
MAVKWLYLYRWSLSPWWLLRVYRKLIVFYFQRIIGFWRSRCSLWSVNFSCINFFSKKSSIQLDFAILYFLLSIIVFLIFVLKILIFRYLLRNCCLCGDEISSTPRFLQWHLTYFTLDRLHFICSLGLWYIQSHIWWLQFHIHEAATKHVVRGINSAGIYE